MPTCFNPSPVCGTGEITMALTEIKGSRFQSVSGLWDRRNANAVTIVATAARFQSVSGLWDRRNRFAGARRWTPTRFNPSPVCGTGEIRRQPRCGDRRAGFNPSPVCGTGEMRLAHVHRRHRKFQSVSGLWDRRNWNGPGNYGLRGVSIRLRSVGPEKSGRGPT